MTVELSKFAERQSTYENTEKALREIFNTCTPETQVNLISMFQKKMKHLKIDWKQFKSF